MPIREYQASDPRKGCHICRKRFERLERLKAPAISKCPQCGAELVRLLCAPRVGASQSSADDRAKRSGFHKLKKLARGEYEKIY